MARIIGVSEIRKCSIMVYKFLVSETIKDACVGRYDMEKGIYVNIDEYITCNRAERLYEAHKAYYDYQYVISGCETVEVKTFTSDRCTQLYNHEKDISFYDNSLVGEKFTINEKEGILIPPEELHMPCLAVGRMKKVKKAVVKIPVDLVSMN